MTDLEQAILRTVAYADLFDYPLNAQEIHRYLWREKATYACVSAELQPNGSASRVLSYVQTHTQGYFTLPDREWIVDVRMRRENYASALWAKARLYSRMIAQLPFVRMVALTGSLAMDNVGPGADIDYLIITAPGRLWLCRAAVIALTMWAARRGDVICPNFFLSENALALPDRNFYTAHEFTQMIPLFGMDVYQRMYRINHWVTEYLPNALGISNMAGQPHGTDIDSHTCGKVCGIFKQVAEASLSTPPGGWMERWEMRRKLRKFDQTHTHDPESNFGPDICKGHFNHHMARTLESLTLRLREVETRVMQQPQIDMISA